MKLTGLREGELPDWVFNNILKVCPVCQWPIMENNNMTARKCSNPKCPEHMSYKAVELCKFLGIKGIGPATAKGMIRTHNLDNHFELMPYLTKVKPMASLVDIAELACVEGYGRTQAEKELSQMTSFEQYFTVYVSNPLLRPYEKMLCDAQKYFTIKPPLSSRKIYVMGTGSFHNFNSREEYFNLINDRLGKHLHVIQTGKRKTGVSYLIKEEDAIDHSKSQVARENNIPIVTPAQFIAILLQSLNISIEEFLGTEQKEEE